MAVYFIILAMLVYESAVDIKHMRIDVRAATAAGILGVAVGRSVYGQPVIWLLYGFIIGGLVSLMAWISRQGIGYGDGVILAVMGLCIKPSVVLCSLWASMLAAGLYGTVGIFRGRRTRASALPFIPFVTAVYVVVFVFFIFMEGGVGYAYL